MKRFFRQVGKIAGVCGGIGKYFEIDPTVIRILFIILFFTTYVPIVIIYLVIWAVSNKFDDAEIIED
jgi:phage shock protein C